MIQKRQPNTGLDMLNFGQRKLKRKQECVGNSILALHKLQRDFRAFLLEKLRYRGYLYDGVTGWYVTGARMYDPSVGAFTTEDPIRADGNFYSYCGGNPVAYHDPSGLCKVKIQERSGVGSPWRDYNNGGLGNGWYSQPCNGHEVQRQINCGKYWFDWDGGGNVRTHVELCPEERARRGMGAADGNEVTQTTQDNLAAETLYITFTNGPRYFYDDYSAAIWDNGEGYTIPELINAWAVWQHLSFRGWSLNAIAATLGNFHVESTMNPACWQDGKVRKTGEAGGYGLAQWDWNGKRRRTLFSWLHTNGWQSDSLIGQLEFMIDEMFEQSGVWLKRGGYNISAEEFKVSTTHTMDYLTIAFRWNYENAAPDHDTRRKNSANFWLRYFTGIGKYI